MAVQITKTADNTKILETEDGTSVYVSSDLYDDPEKAEKKEKYKECSEAMLYLWMQGLVTDGEYGKIMDRLNAWGAQNDLFPKEDE